MKNDLFTSTHSVQVANGVHITYKTKGSPQNPSLVLLHGIGVDSSMFESQMESFAKAGYFVIVPDMRGHGQSSTVKSFSIPDCARDIAKLLDDRGIIRAAILGVSMGGLIAQQFAVDYSMRTSHLIVVDGYTTTGFSRKMAGMTASMLFRILPAPVIKLLLPTATKDKSLASEYFQRMMDEKFDYEQILLVRDAINNFEIIARLPLITAKTLILVGYGFGAIAVGMAKETANAIPDAQFTVLSGGSNSSNMRVPNAFNIAALRFLASNSRN